jgi:hypothetical protein
MNGCSYRLAIFWPLHQVAVVTGGPGVGKTMLLDAILPMLAAKGMKTPLGRADWTRGQSYDRDEDTMQRRSIGFLRATPRREDSARTKKVRSTKAGPSSV